MLNQIAIKNYCSIATDSNNQFKVNVTSEIPHKLSVGDRVRIKNVKVPQILLVLALVDIMDYICHRNTYIKTFSYTNENVMGHLWVLQFIVILQFFFQFNGFTAFERNEYDTSYTIHDVETFGITFQINRRYLLSYLLVKYIPTVSEFSV